MIVIMGGKHKKFRELISSFMKERIFFRWGLDGWGGGFRHEILSVIDNVAFI